MNNIKAFKTGLLILTMILSCCTTGRNNSFKSVYDLIERTLPGHSDGFVIKAMDTGAYKSAFKISSERHKIVIEGTDKIAICKGFYYYLRYYLKGNISRCGSQIPPFKALPEIDKPVFFGTHTDYRYYLNYCTYSYSFAFWDWTDWEKEIDWMAMQGINLPLAITGTEAVWQNTLKRFNFSEKDIEDFIPGPAYTSWWLMDNLEGWGGPVSQAWIDNRAGLQKKILARMRELGMTPVLPAFYGMVPNSAIKKFPENKIYEDVEWGGFQRPAFIDPTDSLFTKMASVFYAEQEKLYGKAMYYSGDPFHEGGRQISNVKLAATKIQAAMQKHSPGSTWVLQGWQENPTDSLLAGTDKNKTLVLDLFGENSPNYEKRKAFNGTNFIWCNVNNFGGNTAMFANFDTITKIPLKLLNHKYSKYYKGIGLCMEGVFTDPIAYDLFFDMAWQEPSFKITQWLDDYSVYRYGTKSENTKKAISLLYNTVYSAPYRTENVFCARPSLSAEKITTWGPSGVPPYNQDSLFTALGNLLKTDDQYILRTETFRFDVSNICRQLLSKIALEQLRKIKKSYEGKNQKAFQENSRVFLDLIMYEDSLTSLMPHFSFYQWCSNAYRLGSDTAESSLFLWNAKRLVTLWANDKGSSDLHDYAYKEWHGLLSDFYYPRWKMYFDYLNLKLKGMPAKEPDFYAFENAWCNKKIDKPEDLKIDLKNFIRRIYSYRGL